MPRHRFYNKAEWQRARRQVLHDGGWQCSRCGISLIGMGKAAHVHHRKPYTKAPALRSEPQNLVPLCISCHNAEHHDLRKGIRQRGCDALGYPLDADHPWYR